MRPVAIVTGILLGSSVAITLSLAVVLLIYFIIGGDDPALRRETPMLAMHTGIFLAFTAVAAAAFYGLVAQRAWRWPVFVAMLVSLGAITAYYWP